MPKTEERLEVAEAPQLSLQEFCTRLSSTENRVELISGFEHDERTSGRLKDTDKAFAGRYQVFINRPA